MRRDGRIEFNSAYLITAARSYNYGSPDPIATTTVSYPTALPASLPTTVPTLDICKARGP